MPRSRRASIGAILATLLRLLKIKDVGLTHMFNRCSMSLECGSCWAFATIALVEAHVAMTTRKFVSLSEQELVDCAVSLGCSGGGASSLALG